jgi:AcrR family transcriptional regulator
MADGVPETGLRPDLDRLPSGRHRLTRETVVASQRGRLIDAMASSVAEKGYEQTTVADVVERAGVSRRTFYEQFPDKESCFLAAYDIGAELLFGRFRTDLEELGDAGWRERARTAIDTLLAVLAAEPDFAWAMMIEVLGAGRKALARHAAFIELTAKLWRGLHRRARSEDPSLPELPDEVFSTLAGGLEQLVRDGVRTIGPKRLPELSEPMMRATVAIFGARPARGRPKRSKR